MLKPKLAGVPLPIPVYEIESVSGTHKASLLNLPVGQPGVLPQAPIPVDVDGDLFPDVLVSVNLIDAAGLFNNPPNVNKIIAPNIVIERVVKGVPLGSSPPLRINIKLRIKDTDRSQPDTIVRFGYDTAQGGSIPRQLPRRPQRSAGLLQSARSGGRHEGRLAQQHGHAVHLL